MPSPSPPECLEPAEHARSGPVQALDVGAALRCAMIPLWLSICVAGTVLWGGYVTLALVFLTWRAAANYG
jgi:hypothetical protein